MFGEEYIPEAVLGILSISLTLLITPVLENTYLTNPLQSNELGPWDPYT